jgi:hypothetical protein
MSEVMGFDLTPFTRFTPMDVCAGKGGGREVYPPFPRRWSLSLLIFARMPPVPASLRATRSGAAEALMRCLHLDFGDGIVF